MAACPVRMQAFQPQPADSPVTALRSLAAAPLHLLADFLGRRLPGIWDPHDLLRARHRIQFVDFAPLQPGRACPTGVLCTARPTTLHTGIITTTETTIPTIVLSTRAGCGPYGVGDTRTVGAIHTYQAFSTIRAITIHSQSSYYAAPQPSDYSNGPYQAQPEDQQGTAPREPYEQQPSTLHRAPYGAEQSLPPASEDAVTLVFKDGRPPEQIHNYLLTPITLTVIDQHRRDIPVDQIDLNATAKANLQAGVEFSIPGRTH